MGSIIQDLSATCQTIQDVIGTDAGNRGMRSLIVPGDLEKAAKVVAKLPPQSTVVILSGFPCCVQRVPPTETDGPPGTFAIARAIAVLGHKAIVVTESCNEAVFGAAWKDLVLPNKNNNDEDDDEDPLGSVTMEIFPATFSGDDEERFQTLAKVCDLLIACERAGPAKDGICYTMRGINMNEKGLIGPLHRLVQESKAPFIAIGDGGNELGMGKVIQSIIDNPKIANGDQIGCVVAADYLIAASVSNWGGYALAAAIALAKVEEQGGGSSSRGSCGDAKEMIARCLPTESEEVALLERCVAAGCRDGVSGKMEATVDGMPIETSMTCLDDIRKVALASIA